MNKLRLIISHLMLVLLCQTYFVSGSLISDANIGNLTCVPFAYGDFNADKRVDVFCVPSQNVFQVWLGVEQGSSKPLFTEYKTYTLNDLNALIVNIVPGDFNGDSIMDILVVYQSNEGYYMSFFKGNKAQRYENDLDPEKQLVFGDKPIKLQDQPFVADFNGDGRVELLIQEYQTEEIKFIMFKDNCSIHFESLILGGNPGLFDGYAHSLTDLNNDFMSDIVLASQNPPSGILLFTPYKIDSSGNYIFNEKDYNSYKAPSLQVYGQSVFADFDSDGEIEHLLPGCKDSICKQPVIYIYKKNDWIELDIDFKDYGFIPPKENNEFWASNNISVKIGDYDLNGYIDLLVILKYKNSTNAKNEKFAILMQNIPSDSNLAKNFTRSFKIDDHIISLFSYTNVVQASFFDIYEDGYLDVLVTIKEKDSNSNYIYKVVAYINDYFDDVYFLKVMVIPGTCSNDNCPNQWLPYGLNSPGALVRIETTSYDFKPVISYACQLSQSSHMSLQLPYTIFGLGSTPNFIDDLKVGLIAPNAQGISKEWHQIIPNSQLVINPYPRHYTYNWKMQLFITPSKNILMTVISLSSTMVCLIIIIGILQFREKKIDEKERKLESQRFHFDGL